MTTKAAGERNRILLDIQALHKNFGGVQAIQDLYLTVADGEMVGVIGPNGSGKTTLFNVITGIVDADHGSIFWGPERQDLVGQKPWHIFDFGIARTFQNIRLCLGLTVIENVMTGLYTRTKTSWFDALAKTNVLKQREQMAREAGLETIRFMGASLAGNADKLVAELSYPDRRRVEIARAIVSKPRLLLLDEPTAGMNAAETDEIIEDVRKVNEAGMSIILVEHKMKFVSQLVSRVAVLNFGQKIAEGAFGEIRSNEAVIEAYLGRRRVQ